MEPAARERFEREVMPHLDAAYTLARWLVRDQHGAEDVVQDALIRAMRALADCQGANPRGWLLAIVRNQAFSWLSRRRPQDLAQLGDEAAAPADAAPSPDHALIGDERRQALSAALERLSVAFREVVVLRELQGLSYQAIAEIVNVPIGTVMSRLARGRAQLADALGPLIGQER